ncbi:MAG: HAD family hydrolase [Coriobacteriaceae bacterium]|nr:HAD family hydrolase [Coriobacteriaceae bacterium]
MRASGHMTDAAVAPAQRLAHLGCILFDLDGTLIDSVALILSSFRHATAAVLGQALPDEVLLENVGMPLHAQFIRMAPAQADELLRVYREHNAEHHDAMVREYPGTEETLQELERRGHRLGVVTSKSAPVMRRGLELFGLERFFEVCVSSDDVTAHKPDPQPVAIAAELLGCAAAESMYVGDSPHDMASAIAAGAVSVAALWGAFPPEAVLAPGPDFALASIRDLPALLDGDVEHFTVGDAG